MADAISCTAWVGSVQGGATHHRPRGTPASALNPRVAQTPGPPGRRSRALSRQSPRASRLLVGLLPGLRMAVGFPLGPSGLTTQGVRAPVSARARCHQAQPGRTEHCEARGGYSRSARWPPPFTPTSNRRCHASAVRRRPPRRWPEFLHETLPSHRESARLARRLEPQGIEAISVRGHRLCLRRHGRQQLVSIQCPRNPRSPTTQRQMPQNRGVRGERRVRRQMTAVAGATPSRVATRG